MKRYKVTLVERGYEGHGVTAITVGVEDHEHPSRVAKAAYEKMGWNVNIDNSKVELIERIERIEG